MNIDSSFRIGIAGAGLIARDHALSLSRLPQAQSLTFFDAQPDRAQKLADEFNASTAASLEELAEASDILWICTPPFVRREPIEAACESGRAVFCEKPFAVNADDLEWVQNAVQKAGIPFFMGQSNRFLDVFQQMKNLVQDGAIGEVLNVWSTRLGWLDPASAPAWRLDDAQGGGVVIELGVHEIDYLRWIGGNWQSVYARGSSQILAPGKFQEAVWAVGTLSSGATARLDISWANPRYLWQRGIEGTKGSIFFDDSRFGVLDLLYPGKEPQTIQTGGWQDEETKENLSLREQAKTVLSTLASGGAPPVTMEDGATAARTAFAIRESVRTGNIELVR